MEMEMDTGAGLSCMPLKLYEELFSDIAITDTPIRLKTNDGKIITPVEKIEGNVKLNDLSRVCDFVVVDGGCRLLFVRDLLKKFNIDVLSLISPIFVNLVRSGTKLENLLQEYEELFRNELGLSGVENKIRI
ncbi:hypothetical protein JTB14_022800 [Gonioctena quinquepunctata]|nr:hypothetical protein JTB14_022800 [Gonioctena quinquepunctata]